MKNYKPDATYKYGSTTVDIISPEQVLGRKMTEQEKKKVLDECIKVNIEIAITLYEEGIYT